MKDILTKLYYGQIDISNKKPDITRSNKENDLYDKLQSKLEKETFDEFQEFLMLYADRYSSYQEFAFNQGVKLGFSLAKELEDIEI